MPALLPAQLPYGVLSPSEPDTMRVLIDGTAVAIFINSLSADNAVGQRSTASVTVYDATGTQHYDEGQQIDILDAANTLVFSGYIDTDDEDTIDPASGPALIHKLTLKDKHYLADKRLVATSYAAGETCGAIIHDLITTILSQEGVSAGAIADGPTLPDVVFNYCTVAAALDAITQKAGAYWWQINAYGQLDFQPYAAMAAPWSLAADIDGVVADARYGTVHVKRGKPMYRNRQYIGGATGLTDPQTETRKGDGTTTAFTMGYPIAKVPTVMVNAVSKTVGIKGLDTGKDWYWNGGDATLTQDSSGVVLTSSDTLQVVYTGQFPLIIISEDFAQVAAQQVLEGGGTTGFVEDITSDSSLTTTDAAFQEASALLAKYAQKATTLTFQTRRSGLAPGQLLSVTIPQHALSGAAMLIESVKVSDQDGVIIWYDVTALLGPVNTSWVQFFGVLVGNAQGSSDNLSVGASTALVIAAPFSASYTPTATFTPTVYACPLFPWTLPVTLC